MEFQTIPIMRIFDEDKAKEFLHKLLQSLINTTNQALKKLLGVQDVLL